MSIEEIKRYLALCLQGESSIPERQKMLAEKRVARVKQLEGLQASIDYVDWKQQFYADVQSGKRPYISNLIPVESAKSAES